MDGRTALKWLDDAARFSEPGAGDGVTRLFLTEEHRQLINWLHRKSKQLGLQYHLDDSGNVIMRRAASDPSAPTLMIGSHQDSVRNGGKYDGMLGIVLPMLTVAKLPPLPYHIDIVAFGDEEGARFSSTLVGSSAVAGRFDQQMLARTDDAGVTMGEAMTRFGLATDNIPKIARNPDDLIGFVEVHIEQGPVLEEQNIPVGLVTAVTGIERHELVISGKAGHAGTTPMHLRQDALVQAAKIIRFVDEMCRTTDELVGVVGKLSLSPNSVNVIPGRVELTVELRSPNDKTRANARRKLSNYCAELGMAEPVCTYQQSGFYCDAQLSERIEHAISERGHRVVKIFSGAGHDGLAMHHLTPSAMIFVRCKDGLSHHPDEAVSADDCTAAMDVLASLLQDPAIYC